MNADFKIVLDRTLAAYIKNIQADIDDLIEDLKHMRGELESGSVKQKASAKFNIPRVQDEVQARCVILELLKNP